MGKASVEDGCFMNLLVKMNCRRWADVIGDLAVANEMIEIGFC